MKYKILFLSFAVLAGCSLQEKQSETPVDEVVIPISHEYSEVSDYELTWQTMFDVDEEHYYVYIYSTTCTHCEELKNYIIEKALNRGDIYFVKGSSKDQVTTDSKKLIGAENPGDIYILGYPSLLLISNHKCTKNLAGSSQIKSELK